MLTNCVKKESDFVMSLLATYSDGSIKYAVGENQFLVMNLDNHVTQVIEYSKIRLNKGFPPKILDNGEPQYINVYFLMPHDDHYTIAYNEKDSLNDFYEALLSIVSKTNEVR